MEFDHAGIATDDASGLADHYGALFDTEVVHQERLDGLQVAFLDLDGCYFELLEPLADAGGPVADYLDRRGPGVHHLALRTDDVSTALERAREAGVDRIDDEPRPGAWGHDVAFLHPRSTGGVLVEFVEH